MSIDSKSKSGLETYRRIFAYARPHWPLFLLAVCSMVLLAISEVAFAPVLGKLVDVNSVANNRSDLVSAPLLLVLVIFVRASMTLLSGSCMAWISRTTIYALRKDMFSRLLLMPSSYYDKFSSGKLISIFTFNAEQMGDSITSAITILIRDSLTIIGIFSLLFYYQPIITLIFITIGPLLGYFLYKLSERFRKTSKRIQESMGVITTSLQETTDNEKLIKLHNGANQQADSFEKINRKNKSQTIKYFAVVISSSSLIQFLVGLFIALAVYLLLKEKTSAEDFVAYITAMFLIIPCLKRLTTVNSSIQKGIAAGESVFAFLDLHGESDTGRREVKRVKGEIVFDNVSFTYSANARQTSESIIKTGKQVLSNINLKIDAGQKIAIVGKSGGGKSTFVSLLPRFYELTEGAILIDGVDIKEFKLPCLRSQFALVSQSITLFNDTLANNIAYGVTENISRAEIESAADAAHALYFINEWDDGLDTIVGEGGIQLSGGQKQRVAVARALLKNAPILILDEATSALDSESEKFVQQGIEKLSENRTTLVITHRISTAESADNIIVIENGEIVETGTHKHLLELNGFYARYYKNQFKD